MQSVTKFFLFELERTWIFINFFFFLLHTTAKKNRVMIVYVNQDL